MFLIRLLRTPVGAGVRLAAGLLCLIGGSAAGTLTGLLLMMAGVGLAVTGAYDAFAPASRR